MNPWPPLPDPYYSDDRVALYHGDAYELAPLVQGVDALITDPPYGMAYNADRSGGTSRGSKLWRDTPTIRGDAVPFDPTPFLVHPIVVLWGANWFSSRLPDNAGWIVWDKTPRGRKEGFVASDCEVAWTNRGNTVAKFLPPVGRRGLQRRAASASHTEARRTHALDSREVHQTR